MLGLRPLGEGLLVAVGLRDDERIGELEQAAFDALQLVARRRAWVDQLRRLRWIAAGRGIGRFVRELRRTRYDLLLDLTGLLKSSIWVRLARAGRRVGFDRGMDHAEASWLFLDERVAPVDMEVHALSRGLVLLERIDIDPAGPVRFDVPVTDDDHARAVELLGADAAHERLVAISPVATWPTKLWEPDRFAAVADALAAQGCRVVFTGSAADTPVVDSICAAAGADHLRVDGRTGLRELAAIFSRCRVVVSTDSGPMHLAAAMDAPVVALFGPTAPWRTGPWGPRHAILRATDVTCSPCFKRTCQTRDYEPMACMKRIEVDEVVTAVLTRIESRTPATGGTAKG